jgi:hypothetical protein
MLPSNNDWRLQGQERYLMNVKLYKREYDMPSERWDHDHCTFCFEKFSENEGDLHVGYYVPKGRHWICEPCFEDFKDLFSFKLERP